MQGGWQVDSGVQHPKTGVLQAAPHRSLSFVMAGGAIMKSHYLMKLFMQ